MRVEVEAVLFDVDDTLFDRRLAQRRVVPLLVRELPDLLGGLTYEAVEGAFLESDRLADLRLGQVTAADFRILRGEIFLGLLGLDVSHAHRLGAAYTAWYPRVDAPVQNARQVVEQLGVRLPLGVVSNGFPDVQYEKLRTLGIAPYFECVCLSEEMGIRKPDPRIFIEAAARLTKRPQDCLYVGDSYRDDVVGANGAGMQACWFRPGGAKENHKGHQGDKGHQEYIEIAALDELLEMVGDGGS